MCVATIMFVVLIVCNSVRIRCLPLPLLELIRLGAFGRRVTAVWSSYQESLIERKHKNRQVILNDYIFKKPEKMQEPQSAVVLKLLFTFSIIQFKFYCNYL